jgi:2,3-bisphosphoglycerate-dependent phosphoglycerate mutase
MDRHKPREVWFIRHAESVANAGGRTKEAPSYALSERGFAQAEQLACGLPTHPELVVLSPYTRARLTAEPYLRRVPSSRVEEWPVQEVQYLDPALCVDTTQDERRAMSLAYWENADPHYAAPDAESFVAFVNRAQRTLDALVQRDERCTFIFCHGQFISAIAWLIFTRPARIDSAAMRRFYQFVHGYAVPNCSILPVYLHGADSISVGGLWIPSGVDADAPHLAGAGLAGL